MTERVSLRNLRMSGSYSWATLSSLLSVPLREREMAITQLTNRLPVTTKNPVDAELMGNFFNSCCLVH